MKLLLTLEISGKLASLKNDRFTGVNRKTGKIVNAPSTFYKKFEKMAKEQIFSQITFDYYFHSVFILYDFRFWGQGRLDISNFVVSLEDIMVSARVLEEDRYSVIKSYLPLSRYCPEDPGCTVKIFEAPTGNLPPLSRWIHLLEGI